MTIVSVVSTGKSPPADAKRRCLESVASQRGVEVEHLVHDAGAEPPLEHFEFLTYAIAHLPAERIVCSLDLDDHLLRIDALEIIAKAHEAGAWVTFGSYRFADGRAGFAGPCDPDRCRTLPFTASHPKTFRAGLFRQIPRGHLEFEGTWLKHARDLALIFPVMELAGPKRSRYLRDVLYSYNLASSSEFTEGEVFARAEARCVAHVRGLPRLAPVESL
jgi:hypothetical protein